MQKIHTNKRTVYKIFEATNNIAISNKHKNGKVHTNVKINSKAENR